MHQSVTRILPANHVGLKVKPANHSCPGVTSVMSAPRWGPRSVDGQTLNSQPVRCHNACDNCSESRNDGRASGNRDRRLPGPAEQSTAQCFWSMPTGPTRLRRCRQRHCRHGLTDNVFGAQARNENLMAEKRLLEQRSWPDPTGIGAIATAHCRCVEDRGSDLVPTGPLRCRFV
jgi:hypothetical protein